MRALTLAAVIGAAAASPLAAQSLAKQVTASDGAVQVIYPSRPTACGDGRSYVNDVLGGNRHDGWRGMPCEHGPARVVATVVDGQITRLRAYVGPVPRNDMRTINASVADARGWLEQLVASSDSRVGADAMLPLVLADTTDPWPLLLGVARDDRRSVAVRRSALTWLAQGVSHHLGIDGSAPENDDDEMKKQAVFVLSQRAKREGTSELMEVARTSKRPAVRNDAIFWLGQSGDTKAVADLFAELLSSR
jgi:hypothetical protein